jgi:formate C-acetyltransferase
VSGYYSSTCHVAFGDKTGALPSGRKAKEPFAASLGACNGKDRHGPTAVLNSVTRVDGTYSPNGYAVNLRFDSRTLGDGKGRRILSGLITGFFDHGGMEVQFNILDPRMLSDARKNPGKYPGLVVRVAGYCAYFDDLPDAVKAEIINRNQTVFT